MSKGVTSVIDPLIRTKVGAICFWNMTLPPQPRTSFLAYTPMDVLFNYRTSGLEEFCLYLVV
jgi:hypothetical protein